MAAALPFGAIFRAAAFLATAFLATVFFVAATFFAAIFLAAGLTGFAFGAVATSLSPAIKNFDRSFTLASQAGARPRPLHVAPDLGSR
ncbi:hypothetical protein DF055_25485 [Burkholderia cepacia]|nr:hypothetical protein DF055_25485 [Burkholderia cepacia]